MSSGVPTFVDLVRAESVKLSKRTSVRLAFVLLFLIAVGWPILLFGLRMTLVDMAVQQAGGTLTAEQASQLAQNGPQAWTFVDAVNAVVWTRNFFVFRALLIAVVAVSVAGEFVARTLREDLVRPVSRSAVLLAKVAALQLFVAATLVLPLVLTVGLGAALLGVPSADVAAGASATGALQDAGLLIGLTWLGDAGFTALVVAIAVVLRSVPGTLGGVFLYWVLDKLLGFSLFVLASGKDWFIEMLERGGAAPLVPMVHTLVAARPWLPSAAFDLSSYYGTYDGGAWQGFVALGLYTALSTAVALVWFRRVDID